jgi:hypothetical protein
MQSWNDEQLAMLRRNYPDWDVWYVQALYSPDAWCARPKGHPVATINTDSPEHLIEEIRRQESEQAAGGDRPVRSGKREPVAQHTMTPGQQSATSPALECP